MADPTDFHRHMVAYHHAAGRDFPWRNETDLYRVLVGEVLLQRTRGPHVVPVYREFLKRWPTPDRLARARLSTVERVIRPLGLARRAATLKSLGQALTESDGIPDTPEELLQLPGIGRYGAHAVPIFAWGAELPLVDWVIARVLRRYFGLPGDRRPNAHTELWALASDLAGRGQARALWLGVLDFADAICKTRPRCGECPLAPTCEWARLLPASP